MIHLVASQSQARHFYTAPENNLSFKRPGTLQFALHKLLHSSTKKKLGEAPPNCIETYRNVSSVDFRIAQAYTINSSNGLPILSNLESVIPYNRSGYIRQIEISFS